MYGQAKSFRGPGGIFTTPQRYPWERWKQMAQQLEKSNSQLARLYKIHLTAAKGNGGGR